MTKKSTGRQNKDKAEKQAAQRTALLAKQPAKKVDPMEELRVAELAKIEDQEAVEAAGMSTEGIWEELEGMYQQNLQVFAGYGMMAELMNQKHILAYISDSKNFIERVGMLKSDLVHQKAMLDQIHAMHAGRTSKAGVKAGGGTILAAAEIAEHYTGWGMGLISVVERNSTVIRGMVADAEKAYNQAKTKAEADAAALAASAVALVQTNEAGEAIVDPDAPVVTEETPASIVLDAMTGTPVADPTVLADGFAAVVDAPAPTVSARGMTTSIQQIDEAGFTTIDPAAVAVQTAGLELPVVTTGFAQVDESSFVGIEHQPTMTSSVPVAE